MRPPGHKLLATPPRTQRSTRRPTSLPRSMRTERGRQVAPHALLVLQVRLTRSSTSPCAPVGRHEPVRGRQYQWHRQAGRRPCAPVSRLGARCQALANSSRRPRRAAPAARSIRDAIGRKPAPVVGRFLWGLGVGSGRQSRARGSVTSVAWTPRTAHRSVACRRRWVDRAGVRDSRWGSQSSPGWSTGVSFDTGPGRA